MKEGLEPLLIVTIWAKLLFAIINYLDFSTKALLRRDFASSASSGSQWPIEWGSIVLICL